MLHGPVGYSAVDVPVLGFAFRVSLRSFHHQSSVAVILRIDGGKLDVEDDEQCHHQCNGQPRTYNIYGREQTVLPEQFPGLL